MANIYNMTDTWTDGSTLTSIKMNVTDTSSAADSKLLDLQVGGSSKLTVGKDGAITAVQAGSVIPFYFANQAAFPSASTYHGAVAHSHADGAMYFAHGGAWNELASTTTFSNRNLIINGAMKVAQRGTSATGITSSGYYTLDRFQITLNGLGTWTQTQDTDAPDGFSSSLKLECTGADASPAAGDFFLVGQKIEGQDLQHLKKGTSSAESVTFSFWVKSNKTGTYIAEVVDHDNSVRHIGKSFTINSSATWEYKTITFAGDTTGTLDNDNGNSLQISIWLGSGTTYNSGTLQTSWGVTSHSNRAVGNVNLADSTSNYFQITGLRLELGETATPFEHRSFGEELELCKRYYQKSYEYDTVAATNTIIGMSLSAVSGTNLGIYTQRLHPQMRDAPDVVVYDQPGNSGRINVQSTNNVTVNGGADITGLNKTTSSFQINNGLSSSGDHFRFHFVAESEL